MPAMWWRACPTAGIRATVDPTPDKLGAKIRTARNDRVTYFAVVGAQETEAGTVALQNQNGDKLGALEVDDLIARLLEEIAERRAVAVPVAVTGPTPA
jgi:threonyl-tRNA synthetase